MENDKTTQKKEKRTGKHVFKNIVFTILIIGLISSVAVGGIVLGMIKTAPSLDINQFLKLDEITILLDDSGKPMDEYVNSQRRINLPISEVPQSLQDAFISIEDSRFETHPGIDLKRLAGSVFNDVKIKLKGSNESLQGASTITQQLVKYRIFLEDSMENRTSIKRKVQEMSLSLQIEKVLTKPQILETYMNTIFLGGNAHGVEAASKQYFSKSIKELTLKQTAFIASAAQSPSVSYNMASKAYKNDEAFESNRTKAVLDNMYKYGKISKEQFNTAMAEDLKFNFLKTDASMNYEYFSRPVILQIAQDLMKEYNISNKEAYSMLMYDGVKIYTTMNRDIQESSQKIIDSSVQGDVQAASVVMDYHTGEVKSIIGGRSDNAPMSYNRAASDDFLRAPGSSIKPLTVYSPAIDSKMATASTIIEDSPVPDAVGYNPKNSPDEYKGYLTLRDCLKYSVNVAAVKIENMIGLKTGVSYGEKFGLQLDNADKISFAAMSLGQLDGGDISGTNPLTMAAAYGVFGNSGNRTAPRLYTKVVDRTGKVLLETEPVATPVLTPQSAYIMYDLLGGPVGPGGTGTNAVFGDMPVRGKTGTSSDSKDLWFVGLTPYYSSAIWIGTDKNDPVKGIGSNGAASIWGKIMKEAHTSLPVKNLEMPSGISPYSVSKDSGDTPTDLTFADPRGNRVYSELFIDGTQPTTLDSIHVTAKVTKDPNGKYVLASELTPPGKIETRVFIKRDYVPSVFLKDSSYVLPTAVDTFSKSIVIPPVVTPPTAGSTVTDPTVIDPSIVDPSIVDPNTKNPKTKDKGSNKQ